jgi:alanyl-tRNA synthetase
MQGGKYIPSKYQGVDTGMGFERLAAMMQGKDDVFETDLFTSVIAEIEKISGMSYQENQKAFRIIADHIKAATLLISEDVLPSNKDQGYIVRRLIRRAIVQANNIGIKENFTSKIATKIFEIYGDLYFDVIPTEAEKSSDGKISRQARDDKEKIMQELEKEENKFKKTLDEGIRALKKIYGRAIGGIDPDNLPKGMVIESNKMKINGEELFNIYQTYGLPIEISQEIMAGWGIAFDQETIEEAFKKHQELSRTASAGKFKGGLVDAGEETTKLHTAAHLMLAAMRQVLGENVNQKGSNITAERLRFDFNYPEKLTESQIKEIEDIVNENIKADLPVIMEELSIEDAKNSGATGVFDDRYGNRVKVYTIGPSIGSGQARSGSRDFISREICGGPHVEKTGALGHFKITKEESSSAGIRRVKAVLE